MNRPPLLPKAPSRASKAALRSASSKTTIGLAAELEHDRLQAARRAGVDLAAGSTETVNVMPRTSGCATSAAPASSPAGNDIDDAVGQSGLLAELGKGERGERRSAGGDHRAAGGQSWRGPCHHAKRIVPRYVWAVTPSGSSMVKSTKSRPSGIVEPRACRRRRCSAGSRRRRGHRQAPP